MKNLTKAMQFILFAFLFLGKAVDAQTYSMPLTGTQTDTVCGGTFYDSGGPVGNYTNSANGILILCPAVSGQYVMMQFASIVLNDAGDRIRIFSGTDTMSVPLFNVAGPTSSAGCGTTVVSNVPGGCLTVHFKTDAAGVASGWKALLYCNPTISPIPPGTNCANSVVIPSIPFTDNNQCTECMINDYQSQSGICNTGYMGEDKVYSYTTSGSETVCITLSNATTNTRLAIYNGCPGSGGSCITPLPMVGNDTMQVTLPGAGTYYIIIDAASGYSCYDLSIVSCIVGIDEHQYPQEVSIFPNPVTNEFTIYDLRFTISEIKIYSVLGEKVYSQQPETSNKQLVTINVADFPKGIYFAEVKGIDGKILNKKFVKM